MLSAKTSTSSLFFSPESSCISVTGEQECQTVTTDVLFFPFYSQKLRTLLLNTLITQDCLVRNHVCFHVYFLQLNVVSARQSLASRSGPSLISASSSRTLYKPCLSGTLSERRSSAQFLYFERDNSVSKAKMDWTSDRCRPSPLAAVPKYIVAALCIGTFIYCIS